MALASGAAVAAADGPGVSPTVVATAFNETCRRGFPDLDRIAGVATAAGWTERAVRIPSDSSLKGSTAPMPRFLARPPLMLILSQPGDIKGMKLGCEIATQEDSPAPLSAIVEAVVAATGFGPPEIVRNRGGESARWRRSPTLLVEASATRYNRMHSIILHVFQEPESPAR